ncbi:MAG TPA: hypothetical protein PKI12_03750, partial [Bacteroidales bacterium]|nr:hypothetical protein [Bacteroidales bacterium]
LGSHFFHNVTSMNVGYFSVNVSGNRGIVNWDIINDQSVIEHGTYFRHIRFDKPVIVRMDGKKGIAVISVNRKNERL